MEELQHLLTLTFSSSQTGSRMDAECRLKEMSGDTYTYIGMMKQLLLSPVALDVKKSAVNHMRATVKEGGNYEEVLKMLTEVVLAGCEVKEHITDLLVYILTTSKDRCFYKRQLSIGIQQLPVSHEQIELTGVLLNSLEQGFPLTSELTAIAVSTLQTLMESQDFVLHNAMCKAMQSCVDRLQLLHPQMLHDIVKIPKLIDFLAWIVSNDSTIYSQSPKNVASLKSSSVSALNTLLNCSADYVKFVAAYLLPSLASSLASVQVQLSAYESSDQFEIKKLVSDALQFMQSCLDQSIEMDFFTQNTFELVDHIIGWMVLSDAELESFAESPQEFTSLANEVCERTDFFNHKVSAAAMLSSVFLKLDGAAFYIIDKLCGIITETLPAPEDIGKELKLDLALMTLSAVSSELEGRSGLLIRIDQTLIEGMDELLNSPSDIVRSRICLLMEKLGSNLLYSNPTHYDDMLEFLINQLDSENKALRLQASSSVFSIISDPDCMIRIEHVLSDIGGLLVSQVIKSKEKDTFDALKDYILNYGEYIIGDAARLVEATVLRIKHEGMNVSIITTKCFNLLKVVSSYYCRDWSELVFPPLSTLFNNLSEPWVSLYIDDMVEVASESLENAKTAHAFHYMLLGSMPALLSNNVSFKIWFGFCNNMITYAELQPVHYHTLFKSVSKGLENQDADEVECVCLISQLLVQKCFDPDLVLPLVQRTLELFKVEHDCIKPKLYGVALSYLTTHSSVQIEIPIPDFIYSTAYEIKLLTIGLCALEPSVASVSIIVRNLHTQHITACRDEVPEISDSELLTDKLMSPLHSVDEYSHFRDYASRYHEALSSMMPHLSRNLQSQLCVVLNFNEQSQD
mmetsp:Transcript_30014/g.53234  ORF Transcript_30014/g.53234 Transcript_30014/m.53234 type:complete len:856 (-) Transcript_30014:2651-5218(-)